MLRVGIDGRAFASPAAGVRRYVTGLVRALLSLGEPLEIVALGGSASVEELYEPHWHGAASQHLERAVRVLRTERLASRCLP